MDKKRSISILALFTMVLFGIGFWAPWIRASLIVKNIVMSGAQLAQQQSAALWVLPGIVFATVLFLVLYVRKELLIFRLLSLVFSALSVLFILLVRLQMNDLVSSFLGRVVRLNYQYGFYLCLTGIILLMLVSAANWIFRDDKPGPSTDESADNTANLE